MQPNQTQPVSPEKRYATMMILWGAMFFNIALMFLVAKLAVSDTTVLPENHTLALALMTIGALAMLFSVVLRPKLVARALGQRSAAAVQSAYIVSFAICEIAAICGLLLRFLTNERYYYLLFIIAAIGFLLNRPRRDDVL